MILLLLLILAGMYVLLAHEVANTCATLMHGEGNGPARDYTLCWPKLWFT
jgi:hypothetical protein